MSSGKNLRQRLASSPAVLRLISNDRVMRLATGVMEARERFDEAKTFWREGVRVLVNGHEMPNIDPALSTDEELGATTASCRAASCAMARWSPGTAPSPAGTSPARSTWTRAVLRTRDPMSTGALKLRRLVRTKLEKWSA